MLPRVNVKVNARVNVVKIVLADAKLQNVVINASANAKSVVTDVVLAGENAARSVLADAKRENVNAKVNVVKTVPADVVTRQNVIVAKKVANVVTAKRAKQNARVNVVKTVPADVVTRQNVIAAKKVANVVTAKRAKQNAIAVKINAQVIANANATKTKNANLNKDAKSKNQNKKPFLEKRPIEVNRSFIY